MDLELENMHLENITFRNPRKSSSLCDISNINSNTTLNTSIQSLPNRSLEESYTLLNEHIKKLTIELESANQEIENLNFENKNLKADLDKSKKIINAYKKMELSVNVLESTKEQTSNKKKRKSKIYNKITTTAKNISFNNNESDINKDSDNVLMIDNNNPVSEVLCQEKGKKDTSNENCMSINENRKIKNKNKVLILSDQQGKYVCRYLQEMLGDDYFVSSFCKPGANMATILNSEEKYISNFNSNDIVIVLGGTNDRNPFEFQSCVCKWLHTHSNFNILFSEVSHNNVLNES